VYEWTTECNTSVSGITGYELDSWNSIRDVDFGTFSLQLFVQNRCRFNLPSFGKNMKLITRRSFMFNSPICLYGVVLSYKDNYSSVSKKALDKCIRSGAIRATCYS
jgi:hypothetical protein